MVEIIFYTGTNCYEMVCFTDADLSDKEKEEMKGCECEGMKPWSTWDGVDYRDCWAGDWLIKFKEEIRIVSGNPNDEVSDL